MFPKRYVEIVTLGTCVTVTLFRNKVFADVAKIRSLG